MKKGVISSNSAFFITIVLVLILVTIVVFGLIGAYICKSLGGVCDLGYDGVLCWKWTVVKIVKIDGIISVFLLK